jgi:hypothetical protein
MAIFSSDDDLFGYAVVGFFAGLFYFFRGFGVFRKYKVLADTPVMPVRSIAMGHVEIYGRAKGEQRLLSPVSHTQCFAYQVKIERWQEGKRSGRWANLRTDTNGVRFWLEDLTGRVAVDPRDVEFNVHEHAQREVGRPSLKFSGSSLFGREAQAARAFGPSEAELFDYIERGDVAIPVAERVADPPSFAGAGGSSQPASQEQAKRELEAFREEMRRRKQSSSPSGGDFLNLFRGGGFGRGGARGGRFRLTEFVVEPERWYHIAGCCAENPFPQDENDRHLIRKGENEPTFLISSETEEGAERSLKKRAVLYVFGGGGVALVSLAVILGKLGWL